MADRGDKYNASGYYDPTPYEAIKNIESERFTDNEREYTAKKLIKTLFNMAHLAGFDVVGRIVLRDNKTGEIRR